MAEPNRTWRQWLAAQAPDREQLGRSRWLGPFARHVMDGHLWRLNRRSLPRGVALGLLTGIIVLIPGLQSLATLVLAPMLRANVPVAIAATLVSMPLTTPAIVLAAYWVGGHLLPATGSNGATVPDFGEMTMSQWVNWIITGAGPTILTGLVVMAVIASVIGYFLALLGWRWWQARKWSRRTKDRALGLVLADDIP